MIHDKYRNKHTLTFGSWREFVEAAKAPSDMPIERRASRKDSDLEGSRSTGNPLAPYWHGASKTWAEELQNAETGWVAGAEAIEKAFEDIRPKATQVHQEIAYSNHGPGTWDMGRLIQGHPEPWMVWQDTEIITDRAVANGVISLGLNIGQNAGVSADTRFQIGALVLALIDCLERSGKRCELTLFNAITGTHGSEINMSVLVKKADDPLHMPNLAFAFANAGCQRRLCFSIRETMEEGIRKMCGIPNGGYGSTNPSWNDGKCTMVPGLSRNFNIMSETEARRWLKETCKEFGVFIETD